MTDDQKLEVYFDKYCKTCKYSKQNENKDPCDECLAVPMNENSHKPIYWEAKWYFKKETKLHNKKFYIFAKNTYPFMEE